MISSTRGVAIRGNCFVRAQHDLSPATGASFQIADSAVVWNAESEDVELNQNEIIELGKNAGEPVQFSCAVKDVRR